MNIRFEGKNVLVTGAARGIGRAVALAFARDGANVLVNTRNQETLDAIYEEVSATGDGRAAKYLADAGDMEQINAMCDYMIRELGGIDILVTNAADTGRWPFLGITPEILERHVKTNLTGVLFLNQRAAKDMIRRKVPGRIINFSSIGATKPHRMQVPYDTTKGAIEAITRSAALELAPFGITVNAVAPACVRRADTLHIVDNRPKEASFYESPILRWGEPEDVAWLIEFLTSEYAGFITGDVIPIDGGMAIQSRRFPTPDAPDAAHFMPEPKNLQAFIASGEIPETYLV